MAFQFPASPIIGQVFEPIPGTKYRWNGTGWAPFSTTLLTVQEAEETYVPLDSKGQPDGVASLDGTGKVPAAQLPNDLATILAAVYPVGSIYLNASVATNPATLLGFGTWAALGAGRVLLGVGTLGSNTYALGATGGEATHVLTYSEIPQHSHGVPNLGPAYSVPGGSTNILAAGSYSTNVSTVNDNALAQAPGGSAHENRQPYLVVQMWQRTA
jgi:hypothetical protein